MKSIILDKTYQYKINGSLFVTHSFYIQNKLEADKYISEIRQTNLKANHICYAYKCDDNTKFNDDNEPIGTAGKRILNVIETNELFNILIIVVRYMNKTKLGIGLLSRSYFKAASFVVKDIKNISTLIKKEIFLIDVEIEYFNIVVNYLKKNNETIVDTTIVNNIYKIKTTIKNQDNLSNKIISINKMGYVYIKE